MNHKRPNMFNRESGFVLPIALILLLVSTLIGVTSLRSNSLSETMTRNTIQREVAFSRAEQALLEGETLVDDNAAAIRDAIVGSSDSNDCSTTFNVDGTSQKGFCAPASNPQGGVTASVTERWQINDIWSDETLQRYVLTDDGTKYIVEFVGHVLNEDNLSNCGMPGDPPITDWPFCPNDAMQFRITALAEGNTEGETQVMLQSTYVVAPPIAPPPTP